MKILNDRKSQNRVFKPGDNGSVLLPVQGRRYRQYIMSCTVLSRVGYLDYVIERGVTKPVMTADCNVEINQEHGTWGGTPDVEVEF